MTTAGEGVEAGLTQDVKPVFRDQDRNSMLSAFDFSDYADVVEYADTIRGSLRSRRMPCDGVWPHTQLDKLQRWIDAGGPA